MPDNPAPLVPGPSGYRFRGGELVSPRKPDGPRHLSPQPYPHLVPHRGARRTTQAAVSEHAAGERGPHIELAGVRMAARMLLNKITLETGRPGSGKTVFQRMLMQSAARLFSELMDLAAAGLYPGAGKMRWWVVDPTNAYLKLLYQVVPGDVPIIRATPPDAECARWDIAQDITSETLNEGLQAGLFPDALTRNSSDPFWYTKGREVTAAVVTVYLERKSAWEFHDLIIPFKFGQFLRPLLKQTPQTRGLAKHELVGRLGRDIVSTASSVVNRMAIAAALWRHAKKTFSLRDFLGGRRVFHLGYTPGLMKALAGIANALTNVLVLLGTDRNDEYDHTLLWLDDARFLADLAGLEVLAARGRGAGFGAVYAAQGRPGLVAKWGEARVDELEDLTFNWVTFSAGYKTAETCSRMVGKVEGVQTSWSESTSVNYSKSVGANSGTNSSRSFPGGGSTRGTSSGTNESESRTWGHSSSTSYQVAQRDSVLPSEITGLPLAGGDRIRGFLFNPDTGVFEFETPFHHHFESLPDAPFETMPLRPADQERLMPWTMDDVRKLNLEPTPELVAAVKKTWDAIPPNC